MDAKNLKFEYLHRDEGNYKTFGEIIFSNPEIICPEEATKLLEEKLIDREYFYPREAKVPLFKEHSGIGTHFSDWYEFSKFSFTEEEPTGGRSVEDFIQDLKKQKSL